MKFSKYVIAVSVALFFAFSVSAQNGMDGYSFLNIPTSSHVFGMGGTNIALIDDDVMLVDQNPALIGPELENQIALNYMYYMSSGNFAALRYGNAAGEHGGFSLGLRYMNYGKFDGYDEFGTPTGSFNANDVILEGSYSRDITTRWRGGASVKLIYSGYANYTAFALAADLGVNYYDDEHDLSFSVLFKNMGGQIKRFDSRYNRVPFDIQLGYMQTIASSNFQISINATNLTRWDIPYYSYNKDNEELLTKKHSFISNFFRHLIFGLQFQPSDKFYACLGYNYKVHSDMSNFNRSFLSGFSLGLGFNTRGFKIGVAYAMPHKSASSLMLNLSYTIGELAN